MRLLMLLAVVFLAIAVVLYAVPASLFGDGPSFWLALGLLTWALDVLLGGYTLPIGVRQAP